MTGVQTCALPISRERVGRTIQRQILEAHVVEESDPGNDLLDDFLGDCLFDAGQRERIEKLDRIGERHRADIVDRAAGNRDIARFPPQPRTAALGTVLGIEVLGELLAHHDRVGFAIAPLQVRDDPFKRMLSSVSTAALDRKSTRLNSSHMSESRMPSSA